MRIVTEIRDFGTIPKNIHPSVGCRFPFHLSVYFFILPSSLMNLHPQRSPSRIICLTEETTEFLYLLGCEDKIVGVSGFTVRPPGARREKPTVSTFTDADIPKIISLKPDLVIAFSDLQADIVQKLMKEGVQVLATNQRSVEEILSNLLLLGRIVGEEGKATILIREYERKIAASSKQSSRMKKRPKVYFEEWENPMISGIRWVSELIEIAGGEDIFSEFRTAHDAKNRIVDPNEVLKRNPDIIIGSWCGKPFKKDKVRTRTGWEGVNAVKNNRLYEINSSIILQPGPAALTDGLDKLMAIIRG